jgi:hypothetical protein
LFFVQRGMAATVDGVSPAPRGQAEVGVTVRKGSWYAYGWVVAIVAISSLRNFLPFLLRDDWQHDDLYQHVWWTQHFADPELFPHDPLYDFFARPLFAPIGYRAIYRLLVPLLGAERVSELLPFALAAVLAALVFALGKRAANGAEFGGVAAVTVLCVSRFLPMYAGQGLPRFFAMPILALFVWALGGERRLVVGLSFLAAALFYPPMVVVMALAYLIQLGPTLIRDRHEWRRWLLAAVPVVVAAGVLLAVYGQPQPAGIGPKITVEVARAMPEFHEHGRSVFFVDDPVQYWFSSFRSGIGIGPTKVAVFSAVILVACLAYRNLVRREMWALLAGGLLAFLLAHWTLFALHLPNRYAKVTIHLFFLVFSGALAERLRGTVASRLPTGVPGKAWSRGILTMLLAVFAVVSAVQFRSELAEPRDAPWMAAMAYLRTLPKDTLVAAHPRDADAVPLLAQRSVLASRETSLPYWLGYYRRVSKRVEASLDAMLATRWEDVDTLQTRFAVEVFLVNRARFTESGCGYSEPFGSRELERFRRRQAQGFVLFNPPEDRILFREGDWMVVRVGPESEVARARDLYRG